MENRIVTCATARGGAPSSLRDLRRHVYHRNLVSCSAPNSWSDRRPTPVMTPALMFRAVPQAAADNANEMDGMKPAPGRTGNDHLDNVLGSA